MPAKPFFFDCETTGLNEKKNDIIQMSFELGGNVKTLLVKPARPENIEEEALKVNGFTREQIMGFPEPQVVMKELLAFLDAYHGRYNKTDKLIFIAHNASFDWGFFTEFFYGNVARYKPDPAKPGNFLPDVYLGNYFIKSPLCTQHAYATAVALDALPKPPGFKQRELLEFNGLGNEKAHDATCDMMALRQLFFKVLCPAMKWPWTENSVTSVL
jgi:DNA polymerase III epsilon subunit-like protein